jgi:hypothetical protein
MPMQDIPIQAPFAFKAQIGGSRVASYKQDSRGIAYRDLDHGRLGSITIDGYTRTHDSQRELL